MLKASEQIKDWSELKSHFVRLKHDLESFVNEVDIKPDFVLADFQQRLQSFERRYADGEVLWRTDVLTWFITRLEQIRAFLARLFRRASPAPRPVAVTEAGGGAAMSRGLSLAESTAEA